MPSIVERIPGAGVSPTARTSLYLIGVLGAAKALSLVVLAGALAAGIVGVIEADSAAWRQAILAGLAAAVLRAGASWATQVVARRTAIGVKQELRDRLVTRLMLRGGRDLEVRAGGLASLAGRGLDDLDKYFTVYLPALVGAATVPLLVGARILFADWVSALIIVLTIPLVPIFMILIGQHTQERVGAAANSLDRLSSHLVELARGLPVLVGLGRAAEQTTALRRVADDYRHRTMGTLRVAFLSSLALELISTISVAVVAVFIGVRLVHGDMPLEVGLLALILAPECFLPFREVGAAHHAAEDGVEAYRRVQNLLDTPTSTSAVAATTPDAASPGTAGLVVQGLTVRYPDRKHPAVDNLSFRLRSGQMLALTGESGAGKSTVLAAIAGLLGDSDSTRVSGQISGPDPDRIAWLPQTPLSFAETVRAEVELYLGHRDQRAIASIAAQVQVDKLLDRHPATLSPGELRRLGMARVLARVEAGADTVLLDEPTAHLDPVTAQVIRDVLVGLRGRATMIVVAHSDEVIELADVVVPVSGSAVRSNGRRAGVGSDQRPPTGQLLPSGQLPSSAQLPPGPPAVPQPRNEAAGTLPALLSVLQPWRPQFIAAVVAGVLASAAAIALTATSGWLIVRASQQPPILYLLVAIVAVRFFGIARSVLRYCERLWLHDSLLSSLTDLRVRLWQTLSRQGMRDRRLLRSEGVVEQLVGTVDDVRDVAPRTVLPPLVGLLTGLAAIVALAAIYPPAAAVLGVVVFVCVLVAPLAGLWADRAASRGELLIRSTVLRRLAAIVLAAEDLAANGRGKSIAGELRTLDESATAEAKRGAWALGAAHGLVIVSCYAGAFLMLAVTARGVAAGSLAPEFVAVCSLISLALVEPLSEITSAIRNWPALSALLGRMPRLVDAEQTLPDALGHPPLIRAGATAPHVLRLDDLTLRWPTAAMPVFFGLTAEVRTGQWLVVTGPSGSGKSTLISALMGFLKPEAGRIFLDGENLAGRTPEQLSRRIAWCPQEGHIFDSSLRANLLLARSRDERPGDDELTQVLHRVGLGPLLRELSDGLDTGLGAAGAQLSGGQRQRVAVARTLLASADLVVLDEPCAHLDAESSRALMADLRAGLADRMVLLVTHQHDQITADDVRLELGAERVLT
ncbi:thiol reductant ABC exporter subunit CydD [Saxibacter everestensis]|uniref:Thiol reductant ABC exporter subunit CydD n=1 Tax=Saxibacter everestensis TaxID=2909229 RepID=A0ABY8QWM9_9MICO|nr:thiol reductant ABC exporter subunit CydD [Brevibacteriaceae bacterium ZFBP1038]